MQSGEHPLPHPEVMTYIMLTILGMEVNFGESCSQVLLTTNVYDVTLHAEAPKLVKPRAKIDETGRQKFGTSRQY